MEQTQYGYWLPPNISTHGAGIDQADPIGSLFHADPFCGLGIVSSLLPCQIS